MKKLLAALFILPLAFALLLALVIWTGVQQGKISKSDLAFLYDLGMREGPSAVINVVKSELYGADLSMASDPSYGRIQVEGRGHAPWVLRGNLDERPRVLKFALQPGLWAAYDVESLSLYQVWEGEVLFEGAAYNYKHGPQPTSTGQWYMRDEAGSRWAVEIDGVEQPAVVRYRGHEYGSGMQTAAMRFVVEAPGATLELTESPEVIQSNGRSVFTRKFERHDSLSNAKAVFYTGHEERYIAQGMLEFPLGAANDIAARSAPNAASTPDNTQLSKGKAIIADSDCLGCHGEQHRIAGPAWSQISGKFRGKMQTQVIAALATSVVEGSQGTWGEIPMPAHPELSTMQAQAAVAYILSIGEPDTNVNAPMDSAGEPLPATFGYEILPRLESVHPAFTLEDLAPEGFEPKVGGMAFRDDGKLVLSSWDTDGAVYLIDLQAPQAQRVKRIAEGLQEPLGLTTVGQRIFVMQKQELTELIDTNGDDVTDEYRSVSYDWPSSANFHSFAFGLLHRDDHFYFLLSICVLPGGASCPEQEPTQGKLLRADHNGKVEVIASGFRTPNGIGIGPDDAIYVTDNQGDWLPASKLVRIEKNAFYGSRAVPDEDVISKIETPPVVWLPQDEVGNSPTEPLLLTEGPYAGQMIHGDVYNGGIKRVFLETVGGQVQGAAFHFSAGLQAPVNRLVRGPDNAIYVGEAGSRPNWGEFGKPWYGLERLTYNGKSVFEIQAVNIREYGFDIQLTEPLAENVSLSPDDLLAKQWFYYPNEQYGGPKYNEYVLPVERLELSEDRRSVRAHMSGVEPGHVVYLRLSDKLRSADDNALWTAEAWYTVTTLAKTEGIIAATNSSEDTTKAAGDWQPLFDGKTLDGWRNYGGDATEIKKWRVDNGEITLAQAGRFPMWDMIKSALFGGGSGDLIYYAEKFRDFELSLEWKIGENGNSGIFYLVADESEKMPWLTGIEMQVLHNEGHSDGKIKKHRAGDLYDLIAAEPETVLGPGQWNTVRIKIQDNLIEHWLNGEKVVSVKRGGIRWNALVAASKFADMPLFGKSAAGYIVLQDHGDPVWYRNIKVRKL